MKRHTWIIFICVAVCVTLLGGNAGAERAIKIRSQFDGTTLQKKFSTGTNYALIIGINEYENHPNLKTAINDADAVAKLLEERYFFEKENIIILKDREATKDHIMREFRDLVATKVKKGDNVFIYYAGHGWFDDILESGYWVTAEATKSPATFLENNTIYKFIAALDKKGVQHVLLVSDSCFSGSFTKDHRAIETDIDDRYFREKYGKPSRNILTSGGLEPVEDVGKGGHSIFAYYFLKALKDNPHPYLSAKQLGVQVEELVTRNSTQTPISKFIHGVGDEGGQFFFINRKSDTPKVSPGPTTAKVQDSTELEKERKLLEQERLKLERLKMEIERKKLEAERKRIEDEKRKMLAKETPKHASLDPGVKSRPVPQSAESSNEPIKVAIFPNHRVNYKYRNGKDIADRREKEIRFYEKIMGKYNANIEYSFLDRSPPTDQNYLFSHIYDENIAKSTWTKKSFFSEKEPNDLFVLEKGKELNVDLVFLIKKVWKPNYQYRTYIYDVSSKKKYHFVAKHNGKNYKQAFEDSVSSVFKIYFEKN